MFWNTMQLTIIVVVGAMGVGVLISIYNSSIGIVRSVQVLAIGLFLVSVVVLLDRLTKRT